CHLARTLDDLRQINAKAADGQAEIGGMADEMRHFRCTQQRLGRDTAPVEADAAEMFALDQRRLKAELGTANGSDITARTTADDNQIKCILRHPTHLLMKVLFSALLLDRLHSSDKGRVRIWLVQRLKFSGRESGPDLILGASAVVVGHLTNVVVNLDPLL